MCEKPLSRDLLEWYDSNARELLWRVAPSDRQSGVQPDPYRVWLSEIMLQQTTVATVGSYFQRFIERWPTVGDLAAAEDADVLGEWAGLGYYARARNLLKCARTISDRLDGRFPSQYSELIKLPGIGPYTASAIAAIAFDRPETVVDGNVERVMSRLHAVQTPLPTAKKELTLLAERLTPKSRPGDYAQAVMDLGATICTPRRPACGICPWMAACQARSQGIAAELPRKIPKKAKPIRHGTVYLGQREDGAWLLETRPDKGLLGGMLGWPGSEWSEVPAEATPPAAGNWQETDLEVRHTFTHFYLLLKIKVARLEQTSRPERGGYVEMAKFSPSNLPTVMRKAFDLASPLLGKD